MALFLQRSASIQHSLIELPLDSKQTLPWGVSKMRFVNLEQSTLQRNMDLLQKNSTNGKNIGTKIINISVHSNGQPNKNIIKLCNY